MGIKNNDTNVKILVVTSDSKFNSNIKNTFIVFRKLFEIRYSITSFSFNQGLYNICSSKLMYSECPAVNKNPTKEIWDIIERRLDSAIKMCPTIPTPYIGAFGPGVFNGITELNLNPEGI